MAKRINVVVSQGQSQNPAKRDLEEEIVAALMFEPGIDVTIIPHLYDLKADGTGVLALQGITGDMIVLSWMFPRAAHWSMHRHEVFGHYGESLLKGAAEEDNDEEEDDDKPRVIEEREIPNRKIYCIDLRARTEPAPFLEEVKRIAREASTQVVSLGDWVSGTPRPEQMERFENPTNNTAMGGPIALESPADTAPREPIRVDEEAGRRWYPVIDFSRCTNCMECIDFCLFGVYGVDGAETILVEQPDNCRKGCPACSRVCPENAIIFPQHKSPAIAGASIEVGGLKIDLSKLFGAPDGKETAEEIAARERDEQLVIAGREAVGMTVGMPKRQSEKSDEPKDELDDLLDALDDMDL